MRRRPFESRRQTRRLRCTFQGWVGLALVAFGLAVLCLLVLLSREKLPKSKPPVFQNSHGVTLDEGLNMTTEMVSARSFTRQLRDQIALAKGFVAIAKESNNLLYAAELSAQIRYSQALLSRAAAMQERRPVADEEFEKAIEIMAVLLYRAEQSHYDTATMISKLKGQVQAVEEKLKSETEKSTKFGQIAAEELPKGLYCFGIKLTMEWFKNPAIERKASEVNRDMGKLTDNSLYHFCVFSDNILAVSVVINSTAVNSQHPNLIVFHLVTDDVNYVPMKAWFSMNSYRGVTVEVQKVEDFSWHNASYVPVLKQLQSTNTQNFYFSTDGAGRTPVKFRNPKYMSMLNHLRFYMPEIYPKLQKIVFLDDDVVVQKDLSGLFAVRLNGNVIGAVETCMETFHRFHKYLNYSHPLIRAHFDPDACGWAFGMNVIDLREWREKNVTGIYHYWQERNTDHTLWNLGTLPPGLLAFYGLVEPLDPTWHVLGLGYTNVDLATIKAGAVLHYNGNMKPWLKIGMEKYKGFWSKYVDYSHPLLQQCFVH